MTGSSDREKALEKLVSAVGDARAHLLDSWEATALLESLGYTDGRIRREFGFPDAAALGEYVFGALAGRVRPAADTIVPPQPHALRDLIDCIGASMVAALPWLGTFLIERVRHGTPTGIAGLPLSLSLMLSLIVSGGFIQAISRRGRFYLGLKQPGLARMVTSYLFRLGVLTSGAAALAGLVVGWYVNLFPWPYLILWADQFVVLCALWLTCGMLAVHEEHWRVLPAFGVGALTFVAVRAAGQDVRLAQLIGSGAALGAAAWQVPRVFARAGIGGQLSDAPLPRMSVLLYRALPFFAYGTLYFCFLFAGRLSALASGSALSGSPSGMEPPYKLGMDLALLSFLFASAGIEYGSLRFTRLLTRAMQEPFDPTGGIFARRLGRIHLRVLAIVVCTFIPISGLVGGLAKRLLSGQPPLVWTTVAVGDLGFLLVAFGLVNGLALFSFNRPWSAVTAMSLAIIVTVTVGSVLSHLSNPYFSSAGLVAGGFVFALQTSVVVRHTIRMGDHAVSAPA